jgi:hypothetical protein
VSTAADIADAIKEIRQAVEELEAIRDSVLDAPTRNLRDAARVLLDRYDAREP